MAHAALGADANLYDFLDDSAPAAEQEIIELAVVPELVGAVLLSQFTERRQLELPNAQGYVDPGRSNDSES